MSVRAFLGIGLAPNIRTTLGSSAAALRSTSRSWRGEKWVPEENLHVTLKFLGTVEDSAVDGIVNAVTEAVAESPEYALTLGEIHAVPRLRAASMVWVTLAEGEATTRSLAGDIDRRLQVLGLEPPSRPFTGHITLARAHRPTTIEFDAIDAGNRVLFASTDRDKRMSVRGITLYASTLTPRGALYEELAIVPLKGD